MAICLPSMEATACKTLYLVRYTFKFFFPVFWVLGATKIYPHNIQLGLPRFEVGSDAGDP